MNDNTGNAVELIDDPPEFDYYWDEDEYSSDINDDDYLDYDDDFYDDEDDYWEED